MASNPDETAPQNNLQRTQPPPQHSGHDVHVAAGWSPSEQRSSEQAPAASGQENIPEQQHDTPQHPTHNHTPTLLSQKDVQRQEDARLENDLHTQNQTQPQPQHTAGANDTEEAARAPITAPAPDDAADAPPPAYYTEPPPAYDDGTDRTGVWVAEQQVWAQRVWTQRRDTGTGTGTADRRGGGSVAEEQARGRAREEMRLDVEREREREQQGVEQEQGGGGEGGGERGAPQQSGSGSGNTAMGTNWNADFSDLQPGYWEAMIAAGNAARGKRENRDREG